MLFVSLGNRKQKARGGFQKTYVVILSAAKDLSRRGFASMKKILRHSVPQDDTFLLSANEPQAERPGVRFYDIALCGAGRRGVGPYDGRTIDGAA